MIKIVKLSTGEEIIGDVNPTDDGYSIKQPCLLTLMPPRQAGGDPTMAMLPYAVHTKEHLIEIAAEFLIWQSEPVKELYNQYNSVFGSGIVVPKDNKVAFHPV
ncbi:hypothetical protein EBR43_09950 [bacterium]|nr:hypothetical protein [bacterium]